MKIAYKNWCCSICNKIFDTRRLLEEHKKEHIKIYHWKCTICNKEFESRQKMQNHRKEEHIFNKTSESKFAGYHPIINVHCRFCDKICKTNSALTFHEKRCEKNPNRISYRSGYTLSEQGKLNISKGLKKAHAEGRAHNWSKNVKINGMSKLEKWFVNVIEKENLNKDYEYNKQFFKYKIDFAWCNKKLAIEIDGIQHERFKEYKESDENKDKLLLKYGWKILRIKYNDICNNEQKTIENIKEFLNEIGDLSIPLWKSRTEILKEKRNQNELNGVLKDSEGKYCPRKLTENEWEKRKQLILNSGVDFSKFGWKKEVENKTKMTKTEIKTTINHFKDDFSFAFHRK